MTPELLVGRDEEVGRLKAMVNELLAGRGGCVWIEGEPGIGKSALLAASLAEAQTRGCQVFWTAADELAQRFPLRVLLDCLQVGPGAADGGRAEIAELLRGGASSRLAIPGVDPASAAAERLLALVQRVCAESPVLLVLDDLQWADDLSLTVWQRLHQMVRRLPLLLVGACRPVPQRAEVAALRRGAAHEGSTMIYLGPLPETHVVELVARLAGANPGPHLRRQAERAGGRPLYLREFIGGLRQDGQVHVTAGVAELTAPGGEVQVPPSLAAAIERRLGFLSGPAVTVLRVAALLGPAFSVEEVGVLTGRTTVELVDLVAEAVNAGVLAEQQRHLVFRYPLIRQALYAGLPAAVRGALHRRAAHLLAGAGASVDRVAAHLLAAPDAAGGWVVDWVMKSAPALVYRAPQSAVDLLGRVREVLTPVDVGRDELDTHLVTALLLLGRNEDVERLARPVLVNATDPDVVGQMAWALGYALLRGARYEDALAIIEQAMPYTAPVVMRTARLRAMRAMILVGAGRYEPAEATARQAESDGNQAGDSLAIGHALRVMSLVHSRHKADEPAVLAVIDRALAVVGEGPVTTDLRVSLLGDRAVALDNLGRPAQAGQAHGRALVLAEQAGTPSRLAKQRIQAAGHYFHTGQWNEAQTVLDAAGGLLRTEQHWELFRHGIAALIAVHRDDRTALARHLLVLDDAKISAGGTASHFAQPLVIAGATAAERDGDPARALRLLLSTLDPGADLSFAGLRPTGYVWLPDVVRLALSLDEQTVAQAAAVACDKEVTQSPTPPRRAVAEHCHGLLDEDPARLRAAADRLRDCGLRFLRGLALEAAAALLVGDGTRARRAYAEAIDIYTQLAAGYDIRRTDATLRPLGLRRSVRGPRPRRPTSGWAALTPTELTVARLLAAGHSNPAIAAELLLSRRTVQTHVSHILAKLGAHSRVDIAREAAAHADQS